MKTNWKPPCLSFIDLKVATVDGAGILHYGAVYPGLGEEGGDVVRTRGTENPTAVKR